MLKAYYYFLQFRLDVVVLALLTAGTCLYLARRARKRGVTFQKRAFFLAAMVTVSGGLIAEWVAQNRIEGMKELFGGFGPTYASELSRAGHELITLETKTDDPHYLELIETEKRWLKANPIVADIYTFRKDKEGRLRLIVDSETDYDRDGKYEGEREQRTPIGEIYEEATPKFFRALEGETIFEAQFMPDRWGIWVSSFAPIYDKNGRVEAAVGIDYPAQSWLAEIGRVRLMCLSIALVLNLILLTSSTLISYLSAEIEERKQTQVQLERARESAFQASTAKSEFLAITGHEVRTPLNAILGFAAILSDTKLDATQRRYLETMTHAGGSLLDLLNSILDYTSIESGKLRLECVPWTPAILIHEVIQTMSAQATQKGLSLHFENNLPGNLTLNGDLTRIRQILMNLMSNAVKFTGSGSVTARAAWSASAMVPDRGRIEISIIDTGLGIRPEKIPHLFDAFSQSDSATTRVKDGATGLGLAICKRLADMMDGDITVKSVPGHGSEFTVAFNCNVLTPADADAAITSRGATRAPAPLFSGKALLVDDQRLNRELLKVMMRRCGLESDLAASGQEAIDLAAKNSYTIIFTDIEMPEMDGFSTAENIRKNEPAGKRIPIVAISALTAKGTRERCLASGMDDYMTKPVYLPALQSTLGALLSTTVISAQPVEKGSAPVVSPV